MWSKDRTQTRRDVELGVSIFKNSFLMWKSSLVVRHRAIDLNHVVDITSSVQPLRTVLAAGLCISDIAILLFVAVSTSLLYEELAATLITYFTGLRSKVSHYS